MTYERFSELWDKHVTKPLANRVENPDRPLLPCTGMSEQTSRILIAYGRGELWAIDEIARVKAALRSRKHPVLQEFVDKVNTVLNTAPMSLPPPATRRRRF